MVSLNKPHLPKKPITQPYSTTAADGLIYFMCGFFIVFASVFLVTFIWICWIKPAAECCYKIISKIKNKRKNEQNQTSTV